MNGTEESWAETPTLTPGLHAFWTTKWRDPVTLRPCLTVLSVPGWPPFDNRAPYPNLLRRMVRAYGLNSPAPRPLADADGQPTYLQLTDERAEFFHHPLATPGGVGLGAAFPTPDPLPFEVGALAVRSAQGLVVVLTDPALAEPTQAELGARRAIDPGSVGWGYFEIRTDAAARDFYRLP